MQQIGFEKQSKIDIIRMIMKRISFYLSAVWLPLSLAALFVIQNQIFNLWTRLTPNPFLPYFIVATFALGVLLYGPAILFGKRLLRYAYLFLVSSIVSIIFISQYLYFSFFGGFLQASALKYAGQAGSELSTITTLISPKLVVFLLNIIAVMAVFIFLRRGKMNEIILSTKERTATAAIIAIIGFSGYGFVLSSDENGWSKLANLYQTFHEFNSFSFSPAQAVEKIGIFNYYFGDIIKMVFRDTRVTPEDVLFAQNWYSQKPKEQNGRYSAIAKGRNLIIIQVESLENAVIGKKIDGQEITPNLNKLASQGLYFNNYYTQVGPGNTADAEFVTLNSLYPITNTVAFVDFAHNTYDALPRLLAENGYDTYALHGDIPTFWNRSNIYPSLGYETAVNKGDFYETEGGFETLSDDAFLSQSAEKMKGFKQPFMATLITLSSHTPFVIPKSEQTLTISESSTLNETQKNYLISVRYADRAIGNFIAALKKNGQYNNSLIAIYGDHGSSTGVSDAMDDPADLADLRNSQVPLIVLVPNVIIPRVITIPGSHLDFYPTIADLLGVTPPSSITGQDLLGTKNPVVTHRDPYFQFITSILTPSLAYQNLQDGAFSSGTCVAMPKQAPLPLEKCEELYNTQLSATKASDLVVRGNLLPILTVSPSAVKMP